MINKLGLNEERMLSVEKIIVNTKLNLLDEEFLFNNDIFSLEYIRQMHIFLFGDLYYERDLTFRELSNEEIKYIEVLLNSIKQICINKYDCVEILLETLVRLWELQIFKDGNTRTLLGYLSILNKAFILNLDIDLNKEIKSRASELYVKNLVNQKQLTKSK
ncbi:MAG: hypothetical protein IJE04_02080 [Bacilli bacterium]|nr:hypothetical protein [Bacilli bacterium]